MNAVIKKAEIILKEEDRHYKANGRKVGGLGSFNIGVQSIWRTKGEVPKLLTDNPGISHIGSSNANLLIKLVSITSGTSREDLIKYLTDNLRPDSKFRSVSYLIFFVLHRYGMLSLALKTAVQSHREKSNIAIGNVFIILSKILFFEWNALNEDELTTLENFAEQEDDFPNEIIETINLIRLKHLEIELEDINTEINQDREKIITAWSKLFDNKEVVQTINDIEQLFIEGSFSETKYAQAVDRLRILLVEVTKEIATKIDEQQIGDSTDEHAIFQLLLSKKILSRSEWNLVRSIYTMASKDGAHAIIALKEKARIIRNITYELVLLVISNYKAKSTK